MHLPNYYEILGGKLLPLICCTARINNTIMLITHSSVMLITHSSMSTQCMNLYLGIKRKTTTKVKQPNMQKLSIS